MQFDMSTGHPAREVKAVFAPGIGLYFKGEAAGVFYLDSKKDTLVISGYKTLEEARAGNSPSFPVYEGDTTHLKF